MQVWKTYPKPMKSVSNSLPVLAVVLASLISMPADAQEVCRTGSDLANVVEGLLKANNDVYSKHRRLERAADCGNPKAQYLTGIWYLNSQNPGQNKELAAYYLAMAKGQGHKRAAVVLAVINRVGWMQGSQSATQLTEPK